MIQKALDFLKQHNEVAFATCEGNLPKIRVFQIMKQEGVKLYFATSPMKAVHRQLLENPNVELLASADKVSVRCAGMVSFDVPEDIMAEIVDPGYGRRIRVTSPDTNRLMVWNCGAAPRPCFAPGEWRRFLCLEPANNLAADAITLAPLEQAELRFSVRVENSL